MRRRQVFKTRVNQRVLDADAAPLYDLMSYCGTDTNGGSPPATGARSSSCCRPYGRRSAARPTRASGVARRRVQRSHRHRDAGRRRDRRRRPGRPGNAPPAGRPLVSVYRPRARRGRRRTLADVGARLDRQPTRATASRRSPSRSPRARPRSSCASGDTCWIVATARGRRVSCSRRRDRRRSRDGRLSVRWSGERPRRRRAPGDVDTPPTDAPAGATSLPARTTAADDARQLPGGRAARAPPRHGHGRLQRGPRHVVAVRRARARRRPRRSSRPEAGVTQPAGTRVALRGTAVDAAASASAARPDLVRRHEAARHGRAASR